MANKHDYMDYRLMCKSEQEVYVSDLICGEIAPSCDRNMQVAEAEKSTITHRDSSAKP